MSGDPRRQTAWGRAGHRMRPVNIGTAALENPGGGARAIGEYGDKVAVTASTVQIVDGEHRLRGRGLGDRRR